MYHFDRAIKCAEPWILDLQTRPLMNNTAEKKPSNYALRRSEAAPPPPTVTLSPKLHSDTTESRTSSLLGRSAVVQNANIQQSYLKKMDDIRRLAMVSRKTSPPRKNHSLSDVPVCIQIRNRGYMKSNKAADKTGKEKAFGERRL